MKVLYSKATAHALITKKLLR